MADAATKAPPPSSIPDKATSEDPETAATRKELKETAISDKKPNLEPSQTKASTPDRDSDSMKEQVSSPKKKRAHDELDESKDSISSAAVPADAPTSSSTSNEDARADRSEPEKKRPRDDSTTTAPSAKTEVAEKPDDAGDKKTSGDSTSSPEKKKTSTSAFSSSGLSAFSSSSSPFLQSGNTKTLSSFASGSSSGSASPFASAGQSTKSVFGSGGSLANGSSPFGQVGSTAATKPFGQSAFNTSSFGSSLGGEKKLTTFGGSGEAFKSSKPAKPFGAPESDLEDESDDEDDKEDTESQGGEEEDKASKDADDDAKSTAADDKKKPKLQKVALDDGEAGEATILAVRAKIFNLDKASQSWKERGSGNLKINVPESCVDIDEDTGQALPGTFDASGLEEAGSKVVRLVMRQDSTHRVILNTAVIPAMKFQEKTTTKAVCFLFTSIEGDGEAVSMQIKMSPANAKVFINEIGKIQHELQSA